MEMSESPRYTPPRHPPCPRHPPSTLSPQGRGYSVNVPVDTGCTDEQYLGLFKPIMSKVMEVFQPGAVVLQCGEWYCGAVRSGAYLGSEEARCSMAQCCDAVGGRAAGASCGVRCVENWAVHALLGGGRRSKST